MQKPHGTLQIAPALSCGLLSVAGRSRQRDGRASMTMRSGPQVGGRLYALVAAIRNSPIVVRLVARRWLPCDWQRVRNSPEVDAFVLAWIASHVRGARRPPRMFM